jgi:hypothetical protein
MGHPRMAATQVERFSAVWSIDLGVGFETQVAS